MRNKYLLPLTIASLLLNSCSGDDPKLAESQGAASAVSGAVGLSLGEMGDQLNSPASSPRALTGQGSFDFSNLVLNCRRGGTVTVSGNVSSTIDTDVTPDHLSLTNTLSDLFTACQIKGSDGKIYTIDGTLAVAGSGTIESNDFSVRPLTLNANFTSHITGTVAVVGDQVNVPDCAIDLQTTTTLSGTKPQFSGSLSWNGTVCGNATQGTFSFGKNGDEDNQCNDDDKHDEDEDE